ncbi:MAG TPA: hypothetical protein HA292_04960, partial [Candidatus Nitrosotenuis sp.]|nr:hypothetical protein [Candidatus Nitrosotenuis sp.]
MEKKVFIAIGVALAVAIGILVALPGEPQGQKTTIAPQKNEKLGLVINPPSQQVTVDKIRQVYSQAAESGAGRTNLYLFWNHIEPEQDKYNWKDTDILMNLNQ